ncbi:MAG: ABC transporter ATP-binding protein [Blastocatellia bacterium]|nr:ABC transporter ATP-binding protein [Blastocatellia bacterium]
MRPIIKIENLSKRYTLGARRAAYGTFRESLIEMLRAPIRRFQQKAQPEDRSVWALRGVSFEVMPGEVLGVIGRNGAGKSTLLKILSRITEPTEGQVDIYGRVGSLLEVGTGFHAELSGRENIYLNGAIMGMSRREIQTKFDEIVAFSEVERFLDTPVKHYSSGMYMRLAFSVAAHLEPEILMVDEILAVGDAAFQEKCIGKMRNVAREGRTVLFVSHNMQAIKNLCTRGCIIDKGQLMMIGEVNRAIDAYRELSARSSDTRWTRDAGAPERPLIIEEVEVRLHGQQPDLTLEVDLALTSTTKHKPAFLAIDIHEPLGSAIMQALPTVNRFISDQRGTHRLRVRISLPPLIPGNYRAGVWVGSHNIETLDEVRECVSFTIANTPTPNRTFPHTIDHGYIVPNSTVEEISS